MKFFIVSIFVILGLVSLPTVLDPEAAAVAKVCNQSRQVIDGELEEKCGQMQDTLGYEFLCDDISPKAHCWAEKK